MMAGAVAMAAVIEDFDTQPCKKSRKDENSPLVKTITNYFSPVPKPVEKPFSPPRANNIMDYFMRKAPTKTSSPEQQKVNSQKSQPAEKSGSAEAAVKQPPQKRGRKPGKCARKLGEHETVNNPEKDGGVSEAKKGDKGFSAAEGTDKIKVLKGDSTAQVVQHGPEDCITGGEETETVNESKKTDKPTEALDQIDLSPIKPSKDKVKNAKSVARNSRKKQQRETKDSAQQESSLCDVSVEVNVDEESMLNRSTVTVSFEDFVRSQSQDDTNPSTAGVEQSIEEKNPPETEETKAAKLDVPPAGEASSGEPSLQVSPRTVTVQADVHVVSHKQEAAPVGKLASIFSRKKGAASPKEPFSSTQAEAGPRSPPASVAKRKSNVVLEEDDLELAVLESDSVPKCGETERKQFLAAFKQAGVDRSKTKVGKQKHTEEKVVEETDQAAESEAASPSPATPQDNKVVEKKAARKGRKKAKGAKEAGDAQSAAATLEKETASAAVEADAGTSEEPSVTSTPTAPVLRRSRREAAVKSVPESHPTTPTRKTRQSSRADSQSPARMRKSKHGVFVAQMMLCDSDTSQSPIRIKFIRVNPSDRAPKDNVGCPNNSPLPSYTPDQSKKRKRAKTLVEKAKVIQQSKKAAVKEQEAPRRSSRSEATTKRSYCEDEDSVICLEDGQMTPQKTNTQKSLRSLNDVLGKSSTAGSKGSSGGPDKKARKASIFDESSREASENSQDDEQFRARREFLKSGLPESFKKQIAKTAATKEVYSLTCSSFQAVTHIKQASKDCPLWSLLWPQSSLLSRLQEVCCQTFTPPPSHGAALCVKTQPAPGAVFEEVSGWRAGISESVRRLLTKEVASCNPRFPAETFVAHFVKRRTDHQQQCQSSSETLNRPPSSTLPVQPVGGKRKRTDGEAEAAAKVAKKQRADTDEEMIPPVESRPTKRRGRTRRSQGSKEQKEPADKDPPAPPEDGAVIVLLDEDNEKKDVVREDVLWTDKYQPQHSSDIVGNMASVRKLHSWLKEWKLRADREERTKQKDKKEEGSHDSDWDCGELDSQEGEDMCNTLLITGPTGVGKTAAVYACAQELGFKVFEVNASSQRSGRLILSQLREATQSHQVDSQGVNAHKPSFFNSYGSSSSSAGSLRPGSSPRKINSPRRVVSSPRKHPQSPRGARRGGLAPSSLAKFFKMGQPASKETLNTAKSEQTAASKPVTKGGDLQSKKRALSVNSPVVAAATPKEKSSEEQSKKTATSLILFEEVDVIFDDDSGFLAAVKTFMATTKRPVILTTSDPAFSTMFDGNFEEIHFKAPSVLDASSFLRSLCLAEDVRMDQRDVGSLLRLNGCDVRQSLLQLQFWTRSGGGRKATPPLANSGRTEAEPKPEVDGASCDVAIPPCDTGCTESMLGLPNIASKRDPWQLLKSCLSEEPSCWELLASSKCRGVDLLYSNMETLLPLPHTRLSASAAKPGPLTSLSKIEPPTNPKPQPSVSADCSDDGSPVKVSNRMKKSKRQRRLPSRDGLLSDLDSEDDFVSLAAKTDDFVKLAAKRKEDVEEGSAREQVKRTPLTPEQRLKSLPVSQCLESMGDFFDSMSFLDSCLSAPHRGASPALKDGLTDELRVETDGESLRRGERLFEMHSAVEALSFHRCLSAAADAWGKAQRLEGELGKEAAAELTLPLADHLNGHSFNQDGPCQPQVVQQKREVMDNLMFKGTFGIACSRSAAASSYLPTLRTICRLEQLKEQDKVKRRFLHYLDSIHLGLEKSLLQRLADDFP